MINLVLFPFYLYSVFFFCCGGGEANVLSIELVSVFSVIERKDLSTKGICLLIAKRVI